MTNRLDKLERVGLIERSPDPSDRRGVQLSLTADGRARLDDYIELGAAREQALLSRLTTADKRRLIQLLDKLLSRSTPTSTSEPSRAHLSRCCCYRGVRRDFIVGRGAGVAVRARRATSRRWPMGRPVDRPEHRLAHQLDLVTARLDALDTIYEEARTHLHECLALAGDCHSVYACGSDTTRRMANQAFFTRIYLDADDQITTEPTPSCRLLLDPSVQRQALTWASLHQNEKKRPPEPSPLRTRVRIRRIRWAILGSNQ